MVSRRSLLAALVVCVAALQPAFAVEEHGVTPVLLPGQAAPAWTLATPDGVTVSFPEAASGKPAVIFFWATWCPFCKALMPHIQELSKEFSGEGVEVFAINIWEDGDPVAFVDQHGLEFVVLLEGDDVATTYGVFGTPGLFVTDGNGRVVFNRYLASMDDVGITDDMSKRQKAALSAPRWAELVREALPPLFGSSIDR